MAFVTKVWKNRLVEFAGRRKLKNVATGEEMIFDVSRSEGAVSQIGDAFSDANMNNLEQRIKNQFDTLDSNLGGVISVGTATVTSNKDGYITSMSFATQNNCDLLIITTLTDGIHIDAWYSNGWIGFARRTSDNVVMANSTFNIKYMRIKGK